LCWTRTGIWSWSPMISASGRYRRQGHEWSGPDRRAPNPAARAAAALRRPASPRSWATTASGQPGITAYLKNGGTLERQR
jgi:hypothetical protein